MPKARPKLMISKVMISMKNEVFLSHEIVDWEAGSGKLRLFFYWHLLFAG